ncbi:hypothetical protein tb265_46430 [Gemmatimonadetes bacterium T265]|nr:hypothetical protein tb265_46430 [Gemmatimonadetes bacterium T265]
MGRDVGRDGGRRRPWWVTPRAVRRSTPLPLPEPSMSTLFTRSRTRAALATPFTATLAATTSGAQQPAPGAVAAPLRGRRGERHPEIRKAIRALERARTALQDASHDYGGHRADALAAADTAIRQLKLALQFDKP